MFQDTENAVFMLSAAEGATGTSKITVTATDASHNAFARTFTVNVRPDPFNTLPWLDDLEDVLVPEGVTLPTTLQALDFEGDPIAFGVVTPVNFSIGMPAEPITPQGSAIADMTITPNRGFIGSEQVTFYVYDSEQVNLEGVVVTSADSPALNPWGQLVRP